MLKVVGKVYKLSNLRSLIVFGLFMHRELKLDGAIGHFPEPLSRLKTGHFTTINPICPSFFIKSIFLNFHF